MLCGFYSVSVNAAIGGEAVFKTMNITGKSRASYGIKVDYAVKTQFDHPSIPQNKNVSAGFMAADLAVLFASLKARSPNAIAVTAATAGAAAAAGWIIDELTGQVMQPGGSPAASGSGDYRQCVNTGPLGSMRAWQGPISLGGISYETITTEVVPSSTSGGFLLSHCVDIKYVNYKPDENGYWPKLVAHPGHLTDISPSPVPQNELDEKIQDWLKTAPWSVLDDLLKHPDGTPVDAEPLRRAISDWLDDLASKDPNLRYVPPSSIVVTNPDGSETPVDFEPNPEPDSSTEDKTRPDAADWPLFCEWAPVICDWLEWTKEMPEDMEPEEFPVEYLTVADIRKDYNSGLGGGSCPSPVTTSFMGSQIVFTYETACYGARTYFKPVLLMIAGIIAAFIIVGASRRT
jgi:hypothetical protein